MNDSSWKRAIWIGITLLFLSGFVGCQCSPSECNAPEDCPFPTVCQESRCVLNGQEGTSEAKAEPTTDAQSSGEDSTEPTQDNVEQASTEQNQEPEPEPGSEAQSESSQPEAGPEESNDTSVVNESQSEPTSPDVPEATSKDIPAKACKLPTDCPTGSYCLNGACSGTPECSSDPDCTQVPYTRCSQGYCTLPQPPCKSTGGCVPGSICVNGQCLPGGIPAQCKDNSECPGGFLCTKGKCERKGLRPVRCQTTNQCSSWEMCVFGICQRKCTSVNQCPSVTLPACQGGVCITPNLPQGSCNADSECLPRQYCSGNRCITCKAPPDCTKDADCKTGEICKNGQCGVTCTSDASCRGGFQICSQGFCRGAGYKPVGCPEDQEICDLVIDKLTCLGNGRMEVTVKNIGIGPAMGRFYLCWEATGSKKGCNAATIMNYFSTGGVIPSGGTDKLTVFWKLSQGDVISVDKPDLILEANDSNNSRTIQNPCP